MLLRVVLAIFALHPEGSQMKLFRWSEPCFHNPQTQAIIKIPGKTLLSSIFELRSRERNVRPSVGPCGSHKLFRATWAIFALHPEGSQMTLFRWSEPWFSAPTQPIWSRPPPMDAPWAGLEGGCPPFSLKMGGFGARD